MEPANSNHTQNKYRVKVLYFFRKLLPRISREQRGVVRVSLREASNPNFDFFIMVLLSSIIATLGLLTNSAATIIGAMLVAPLMSPILGLGLASIIGDGKLVRDAASAIARGAILSILVSFLLAESNRLLPFVGLQDIPFEVLARTKPSPIDLGIALAGGMAAAFALALPQLSATLPGVAIATALMPPLCTIGIGLSIGMAEGNWNVGGGAFLLFITNSVTIAFSASLVFFILGFAPKPVGENRKLPRSLRVSALLTLVLIIPLTYISYNFFRDSARNRMISDVIKEKVNEVKNAQLIDYTITQETGNVLALDITIRTNTLLNLDDSIVLQEAIGAGLQDMGLLEESVQIVINQIWAARLDPLIPPTSTVTPTPTNTSTPTNTYTPGPSPTLTPTFTPTLTPSITPTNTSTYTLTPTYTPSPTYTPTTSQGIVTSVLFPGMILRQTPGGPVIASLRVGSKLTILYGYQIYNGLVWLEVRDEEGRVGWLPQIYISPVLGTATATPAPSVTLTNTSTSTLNLTQSATAVTSTP